MPAWIHARAEHLLERNPEMAESAAWAVATQQAYALGKVPRSFGTRAGRAAALRKYRRARDRARKRRGGGRR